MHLKHSLSCIALLCLFLAAACVPEPTLVKPQQAYNSPPAYNYPINNPYAATVIGVPPGMQVDSSRPSRPHRQNAVAF